MTSRAVASSTLWQFASQITMAALSIVTVKFVAIGLTQELAGIYNSSYGYLQLFGILADFGLYAVAVREVAKAENREHTLGALLVLRTFIMLVSLGSAVILVWILPQWHGTALPMGVLLASLVPGFTLLAGIIRTIFQVEYRMRPVFVAEVAQRIVSTVLIAGIVFFGVRNSSDPSTLNFMLLAGGIGALVLLIVSFVIGNRILPIRPHFDRVLIAELFRKAAPFGLAYLCLAFYRQFDLTMIALLRDDFELQNALYGFVLRMSDMGFLLPTFLLNSTLPILSERDAKGEDTRTILGNTLLIILIIGSISALFSALWARPLMHLLTTEAYLSTATTPGSDTALQLIAGPLFLNGIILYSFYVLLARNVWQRLVITLAVGAVVSVLFNAALIPASGFVGAITTSNLVHIILASLLLPQAIHTMPIRFGRREAYVWLIFSAGLAITLWLFRPLLTHDITTALGLGATGMLMLGMGWALGLKKMAW